VDAQNVLTDAVLSKCEGREELKELLKKLMDYPKQGVPYKRGGEHPSLPRTPGIFSNLSCCLEQCF
jgi:hypothetical protein